MDVRARVDELRNDPNVRGKYLSQIFQQEFVDRMLYRFIRYRTCLICMETVEQYDLEPDNVNPRPFHTKCFNRMAVRISKKCFICNNILSKDKINGQSHSPRDSFYRVCDGHCLDCYSIISCKIFGDDMTFLADELELQPLYELNPSKKMEAYQKSRLPRPQLKPPPNNPPVPMNHIFPISKEMISCRLTDKELVFFESGQMTIEEKRHFSIKGRIGMLISWLYIELFFTGDENQRNMFSLKLQENMAKYDEMNKQPPTQRYLSNTGSYF